MRGGERLESKQYHRIHPAFTATLSPAMLMYSWWHANAWRAAWMHSGLKVLGDPGGLGMAR